LPFFSSLLQKSTFYTNAFCYSHESNKGITALLGSVPTITDIPLYHSSFITMPLTKIGATLSKQGYQSMFCIGDNYDDFGFAKCTNWLGFTNYYSKESLPNYKTLPRQAMGVHDEYVLDFMHKKINNIKQPFLAVNFNISTHYDYELPKNFTQNFPSNYSSAMKSMAYYDYSLGKFFEASKKESWFKNTVFIFCSDHWMFPNEKDLVFNNVTNYKIPIIIYDASNEAKNTDSTLASQFDILPTILDISGYSDEFISYGNSLLQKERKNYTFSKINSTLYQIIDSSYALGFNTANNSAEYLYNYKLDVSLKNNLANLPAYFNQKYQLEEKIKAILQKATMQYGNKNFK
jgi:phosphoglycerol transferase MdoB-like AlkP superfamily enzyme